MVSQNFQIEFSDISNISKIAVVNQAFLYYCFDIQVGLAKKGAIAKKGTIDKINWFDSKTVLLVLL